MSSRSPVGAAAGRTRPRRGRRASRVAIFLSVLDVREPHAVERHRHPSPIITASSSRPAATRRRRQWLATRSPLPCRTVGISRWCRSPASSRGASRVSAKAEFGAGRRAVRCRRFRQPERRRLYHAGRAADRRGGADHDRWRNGHREACDVSHDGGAADRGAAPAAGASGRGRGPRVQGQSFNRLIPNIAAMLGLCATWSGNIRFGFEQR